MSNSDFMVIIELLHLLTSIIFGIINLQKSNPTTSDKLKDYF